MQNKRYKYLAYNAYLCLRNMTGTITFSESEEASFNFSKDHKAFIPYVEKICIRLLPKPCMINPTF